MSVRDDATEARCPECGGWVSLNMNHEVVQGQPTHTECAGKLDPDETNDTEELTESNDNQRTI